VARHGGRRSLPSLLRGAKGPLVFDDLYQLLKDGLAKRGIPLAKRDFKDVGTRFELTTAEAAAKKIEDLAARLQAVQPDTASPRTRSFDKFLRSLNPGKRGPKKGSHRDPDMVRLVAELEQDDQRTGTRRSIEVKAGLAGTTAKTYRAIKDGQTRTK
jgi:predicted RecB family endonuclease